MSRALITLYVIAAAAVAVTGAVETNVFALMCAGLLAALALYERAYSVVRREIVWLYDHDSESVP